MLDLRECARVAESLPPLPAVVGRLSSLVADVDSDIADVVRAVELDPSLAGRVLKLANSAARGASRSIGTIRDAVVRVGGGTVLSLALAGAVRGTMRAPAPAYGLTPEAAWRHSVATALVPEALRAVLRVPVDPEAFAAGLLHDVGKVVISRLLTDEDARFLERAQTEGGLSRLAAEMEIFGVNHAELGALVAESWHLPPKIVEGIRHHHAPREGLDRICDVVFVADEIAKACGVQPVPAEPHPADAGEVYARMGLDPSKLDEVGRRVIAQFSEVATFFG